MKRRRLLQHLGVAGGALAFPFEAFGAEAASLPSLRAAAARIGILYGSDSDTEIATAPAAYQALFLAQCGLYAPNASWGSVCGANPGCEPAWVDPNIAFADKHQLRLTGAHLLWHENIPAWFRDLPRDKAMPAAEAHIARMAGAYAGRMFCWNVVNEAIEPDDGRDDGLRRSVLTDQLGYDFFDAAFHAARAADRDCLLAYNDYGMEMSGRKSLARRDALFRLLDRLTAGSAPIDAVGLQSHLRIDGGGFDADDFRRFLHRLAGYKLKIVISELDVFDISTPKDDTERDAAVGDLYGQFLEAALDEPAVVAVVTWGLSDRYTWLTPRYSPVFARPDGLPSRPLPFDRDFAPKPAFQRMIAAFEKARPR